MFSKLWRSKIFRTILILLILFTLYLSTDQLMTVFNKGYVTQFYGQPVLVLGVANKIPKDQLSHYPWRLEKSFEIKTQGGISYREAKYEKNVLIDRVDEHTIYATDAYTGEPYKLLWTKDSGYACVSQPHVELPEGTIDPSQQDLKGIKFFFLGNNWRGILGDIGLAQLEYDFNPNDPAKLYLVNDTENKQGSLEILQLVLFTTKPDCAGIHGIEESQFDIN